MAKAGRPKKGSPGLPEWFDIEKYRAAKFYGTAEWFHQLIFRGILENFVDLDMSWPYSTEWMALVKADPNINFERVMAACDPEPFVAPELYHARAAKIIMRSEMSYNPTSGSGVRPINCGEIETAYCSLDLKHQIWVGDKKRAASNKQNAEKEWWAERRKPYRGNRCGKNGYLEYVRVDLSLPAALLKRDFAEFIKSHSKDAKELQSPFFKSQDFSVWYNSGVLPYLDLRLWELETGQSFRWADFADALNTITDKPIGSEDACRKVAKSLAKKLLDDRTVRMLKFQATKELDGTRKKSGRLFVK